MKINKSTLKQLIREQMEQMKEEEEKFLDFQTDDPNDGASAAHMAIVSAFDTNRDLPVQEIARIAVNNLMTHFDITLKPEHREEMSPEEYERLKMPGLDEARINEQMTTQPLAADDIADAVYGGMKANKKRSEIRPAHFVEWGKKNGLELEYVHATDKTRPGRQPSQLAFRVFRTDDKSKALEAKATGIADYVHVVQPPEKDKPYYILYSGEGIVDRTSQANMKTTDSNKVPFEYGSEKINEVSLEKDALYQKSEIYNKIARNLLVSIKGAIEDDEPASALQGVHDEQLAKYKSAARDASLAAKKAGTELSESKTKLTKESLKRLVKEELAKIGMVNEASEYDDDDSEYERQEYDKDYNPDIYKLVPPAEAKAFIKALERNDLRAAVDIAAKIEKHRDTEHRDILGSTDLDFEMLQLARVYGPVEFAKYIKDRFIFRGKPHNYGARGGDLTKYKFHSPS